MSKRIKTGLTANETTSMIEAAAFARSRGWMLTRYTTIRLASQHEALPPSEAQARVRAFLKHACDWMRYHDTPLVCVWVIETNPRPHVHILAYCPDHLRMGWQQRQRGWMTAAGIPWGKGAIETTKPVETLAQLKGVLRYMCKSLEDTIWREHLRIEDRGPQGLVIGKRRGFSQNIGELARARHYAGLNHARQLVALNDRATEDLQSAA